MNFDFDEFLVSELWDTVDSECGIEHLGILQAFVLSVYLPAIPDAFLDDALLFVKPPSSTTFELIETKVLCLMIFSLNLFVCGPRFTICSS